MSCEWRERVAALEDEPDVRRPIAACEECRDLEAGLMADLAVMRAAHEVPLAPAHYTAVRARVMDRVAAERRRSTWRFVWLGAASVAVVAGLLVPLRLGREDPGVPPRAPIATPRGPEAPILSNRAPEIASTPRRGTKSPGRLKPAPPTQLVMVKLLTDDPRVVIYWMVEPRGESR